jgi:hypothetical protein
MPQVETGAFDQRIHLIGLLKHNTDIGLVVEMEGLLYPVLIHGFNAEHLNKTVVIEGTWANDKIIVRKQPTVLNHPVQSESINVSTSKMVANANISVIIKRLLGQMKMKPVTDEEILNSRDDVSELNIVNSTEEEE